MTNREGIDLKLRAAFLLPALLSILVLALIDAFITNISWLTIWLFPVISFTAILAMVLTERKRRRRIQE